MKIESLTFKPYQILLTTGQQRRGMILTLTDKDGRKGSGEIAPLPNWSTETLEQATEQLHHHKEKLTQIEWASDNYLDTLKGLLLYPSVTFGLESALLSILSPLPPFSVEVSALLMGSPEEILRLAKLREAEGFRSAKVKVNQLTLDQATQVIDQLKERFLLRIDVNRGWKAEEAIRFFSRYSHDAFDYVEEPFQDPKQLEDFQYPLAIDESFPTDLSLKEMERLPFLKAIIYKPTIQGGMANCIPIKRWADERGISLVLSSAFESDIGLAQIAAIAQRLGLSAPLGLGTYHYLSDKIEPTKNWLTKHTHFHCG